MSTNDLSAFVGARTRLQRLSDQRIFSGWIASLALREAIIEAEDAWQPVPLDRFLVQVQGDAADAYFIGLSVDSTQQAPLISGTSALAPAPLTTYRHRLEVVTEIQLRSVQQLPRHSVRGLSGHLISADASAEVMITDASAAGMGVVAWRAFEPGEALHVSVCEGDSETLFSCVVKHCRAEPRFPGAYRLGLAFEGGNPETRAQWLELLAGFRA